MAMQQVDAEILDNITNEEDHDGDEFMVRTRATTTTATSSLILP